MAEVQMSWYVLRAVSGKEAKVKEYIDAEINNGRFGGHVSQVLIPTEKVVSIRNGKRIEKERNYLPGYVLVEARLVGEIAHTLRNTPQCLGFLGGLDNPTPLRQDEVNRILGKIDDVDSANVEVEIPYVIGDSVKVCDGPFNGFTGTVKKVDGDKKVVSVEVTVFGRPTPLDLGFNQIVKE